MTKPTYASVTTTPCKCNYLQNAADQQGNPIVFNRTIGEYTFNYNGHRLVIYHCPFCGGAAPESKRPKLFVDIPPEEKSRLAQILDPIDSIESAIAMLGPPDYDGYIHVKHTREEGESPRFWREREIRYHRLSDVADFWFTESKTGKAYWQLQGKYLPRSEKTEQ